MSRWTSSVALRLRILATGWRLAQGEREIAGSATPAGSLDTLLGELAALQVEDVRLGQRLNVVVADRWVQSFDLTPPPGVQDFDELQRLAQARRLALFGTGGPERVVSAPWQAAGPFVAVAAPTPLIEALRALCQRHEWTLGSLLPVWAEQWSGQSPLLGDDAWLAVGDGPTATIVRQVQGRVGWVRTRVCAQAATLQDAQTLLTHSASAAQGPNPADALRWVGVTADAEAPQGRRGATQGFELAPQSAPWRHPATPMVAASLVAAAATAAIVIHGATSWRDLRSEQQTLSSAIATATTSRAPPKASKPAPGAEQQFAAARRLVARLDAPWPELMRTIEVSAHPDTALLALEIDGGSLAVRGAAMARHPGAMLQYLDRLREHRLTADAQLVRHETAEKEPGKPLRFDFSNHSALANAPAASAGPGR